jgi:hypothetical protein
MRNTEVMVPGILVALKTSVRGGVEYQRSGLDSDDEGRVTSWETTRYMDDPAEHKAAVELAGEASRLVSKLCVRTNFGLLCKADREAELDAAVIEMRRKVAEWNQKSLHSYVYVTAIKGRIADNDEEAIRAIVSEATELLDRMDAGIADGNVAEIRDAALRAKRLTEMMTPDAGSQVNAALSQARQVARTIVKRGEDLSDRVANVTIEVEREQFAKARFAFLETAAAVNESLPSIDLQRGAELELEEAPVDERRWVGSV